MSAKIFVFGAINGQIETAFKKLATLHAKNNFSFAIVAGNLFDEDDDESVAKLLDGSLSVPVSTYFTVGTKPLPQRILEKVLNDAEICDNLHYLGKRSVTKTSDGIRIVTLGGVLDPTIVGGQSKEQHLPFHTVDDAKALRGANSADILLSTVWPALVWNGSKLELPLERNAIPSSDAIADLVTALRPRYHISPSPGDFFFEREPFTHPPKDEGIPKIDVTRFISLAALGNAEKAKAMYAFSLSSETTTLIPQGATASPFPQSITKKRPAAESGGYSRFSNHTHDKHHHKKRRRDRSPPPGPDQCYFCLSNPNLDSHMVTNIGEEAYLATAKGPLPTAAKFSKQGLGFPGHMILVPLSHAPTITTAAMQDAGPKTFTEMSRFREALQAMVSSRTQRKLGSVTWEISRSRNIHAHWQFLPVPSSMVKRGLVEAAFRVEAENLKLPKLQVKDFGSGDEVEGDYFRVWIWAEEEKDDDDDDDNDDGGETNGHDDGGGGRIISKSLLMRFGDDVRFDLQYGRKVMAKLMGLEDRTIWQNCTQTEDEETVDVAAFREAFKDWDFT